LSVNTIDFRIDDYMYYNNTMCNSIYGAGGGSSGVYNIATGGSSGTYSISTSPSVVYPTTTTTTTGGTYAGTSTGLWNTSYANPTVNAGFDSDITLSRTGRPDLKIGQMIDLICEHLNIIVPDQKLMEDNPSLKLAYEHYQETVAKTVMNPEVKAAADSYRTIEKLVKETEEK